MKNILVSILLFSVNALHGAVILNGNQSSSFLQNLINQPLSLNGSLDQTFGNNATTLVGTSLIPESIGSFTESISDNVTAIALQPDGKIVAVGFTSDQHAGISYWAFARFTPNGKLDPTFTGGNGTTSTIPGTVYIGRSMCGAPVDSAYDQAFSVAIQSDGKIVVGGYTYNAGNYYFALARLTDNGSLDESFIGGNGTTTIIPGTVFIQGSICGYNSYPVDQLLSLALQKDGAIVAGGWTSHGYSVPYYFALAKFNSEGALDTTFIGGNGTESTIPGTVFINGGIAPGSNNDILKSLAITKDGSIIACGSTSGQYMAVAQVTSTGALNSNFVGGNGTLTNLPGTIYFPTITGSIYCSDQANSLSLRADGKIVVGGFASPDGSLHYFTVAQLTETGAFDTSFIGGNGTASRYPGTVYIPNSICGGDQANDQATTIGLQNNETIVAAGWTNPYGLSPTNFALARFLNNGALDISFKAISPAATIVPGTVYIPQSIADSPQIDDQIASILIKPDFSIVAGGFSTGGFGPQYFALAQFFNPQKTATYKTVYSPVGAALNC